MTEGIEINSPGALEAVEEKAPDPQEIIRRKKITTPEAAAFNRENLKNTFQVNSYLIFLFRDFWKIRQIGAITKLISTKWLPPGFVFHPGLYAFLIEPLQKEALEVMEALTLTAEKGWLNLEKKEYNLVILYKKLCDELISLKLVSLEYAPRTILQRFNSIERLFLTCVYQPEYPQIISSSIQSVLQTYQKPQNLMFAAKKFCERLLSLEEDQSNLFNFLLIINMLDNRRFINADELFQILPGGVIDTSGFDCQPEVKQRLESYVQEKYKIIQELYREKGEIDKIKLIVAPYFRTENENRAVYDYSLLAEFYDQPGPVRLGFNQDRDNVTLFGISFFSKWSMQFISFLTGTTEIEGLGLVNIFSPTLFQSEADSYKQSLSRFPQVMAACPNLTRRDYVNFRSHKLEADLSSAQMSVITLIDELTDCLFSIGRKAAQIYYGYVENSITKAASVDTEQAGEPIRLTGNSYISYWDKKISSNGFLNQSVFSYALLRFSSLCVLTSIYFQNSAVNSIFGRDKKVREEIKKIWRLLERMSDPIYFEHIRSNLLKQI